MHKVFRITLLFLVGFFIGCTSMPRYRSGPPPVKPGERYVETGLASYYADEFHGRATASGEIFNMFDISAAHKTLPFGTVVKVKNLDNGKEMNVRINDRGPFIRGRIIDLSYGAAKVIGLVIPGTARVRIQVISWGDQY